MRLLSVATWTPTLLSCTNLIKTHRFETVTLDVIYRQAKGSSIVSNAITINKGSRFFVYDTRKDVWFEYEGVWINKILRVNDALYGLSYDKAYLLNIPSKYPTDTEHEGRVNSFVEFDDTFDFTESFYPDKINVRGLTGIGGTLSFEILYDNDLIWQKVGEIEERFNGMYKIGIPQRKCSSFKFRVNGVGYYCIKNLCVECVVG